MSQQYDWGLVVAVLADYPDGLPEEALINILIEEFGWTRDRAVAAIAEAIRKGWIVNEGGVLIVAEPRPAPESTMDLGF